MIYTQTYTSAYGDLLLGSYKDKLVLCDWKYRKMRRAIDHRIQSALQCEYAEGNSPIIQQTIREFEEYAQRKRTQFSVPLQFIGTDFQQAVWNELQKIPFGKTQSYKELSEQLGNVKAIRAVASANGANSISILVPCHRIIANSGELTGYAGGLSAKKKLLNFEGSLNQLNLF